MQVELALSVAPQFVFTTVKSAGFAPAILMTTPVAALAELFAKEKAVVGRPGTTALMNPADAGESEMLLWAKPACWSSTMRLRPCSATYRSPLALKAIAPGALRPFAATVLLFV